MIKEKTQNIKSSNQANPINQGSDNMKQGWEIKKLGDVCLKTSNIKWPNSNGELYDYIDLSSVSRDDFSIMETAKVDENNAPSRAKKIIKTKDIIFATTRPTLKRLTIVPQCFDNQICSTGFVVLRPNPQKIISEFIFYSLLQDSFMARMESLQRGASYPAVTDSDVKGFEIALPPLPEQQCIVSILDEAFAAIAKAKANAEQNLKNVKELFESYLQGVFENAASNSKMISIGEICKLTRGHNPPKSQFVYEPKEGYVRFYQIRDGGSDDYCVYVPDTPKLHKVTEDELLMVAYRHIGRVFRGVSGAFNVALCKITNKDKSKLDDDYLFNIIPTDFVRGELLKRSERSLIPSMSVEHLKEIKIPLPSLNEQQTIVRQLDALRAETQKLEAVYQKKIADLEELKKSILQKAFSGGLNLDFKDSQITKIKEKSSNQV